MRGPSPWLSAWVTHKCGSGGKRLTTVADLTGPGIEPKTSAPMAISLTTTPAGRSYFVKFQLNSKLHSPTKIFWIHSWRQQYGAAIEVGK